MESLYLARTKSSPEVHFDGATHRLEIRGESYSENVAEFFAPVIAWVEDHLASLLNQPVTVNLEIIYANSSSAKVLMDILDLWDEAAGRGQQITINWFYDPDNENARDAGEEFREDLKSVTFNLVELGAAL